VWPCLARITGVALLSFAGSIVDIGNPLMAAPQKLQWRSTSCQLEQDGKVIAYRDCKVAFSSNARMYAVKVWDENLGQSLYFQIGLPGASSSHPECLQIDYEGGEQQSYCTVKTAWELGIKGAPRSFTQQPAASRPSSTPSYNPGSSASDENSFFSVMKRCGRAYPNHILQKHPDQYGYKTCLKMSGY
jgi:hypothetical protein